MEIPAILSPARPGCGESISTRDSFSGVLMEVFLGLIHSTEILTIGYNGYIYIWEIMGIQTGYIGKLGFC